MSIQGIGQNNPVSKIVNQPVQKQVPANAPGQLPVTDRLELSGVSHLLSNLKTNDIRADKVEQIKAEIEKGTYEDDAKLDAAIDRLLDDMAD